MNWTMYSVHNEVYDVSPVNYGGSIKTETKYVSITIKYYYYN